MGFTLNHSSDNTFDNTEGINSIPLESKPTSDFLTISKVIFDSSNHAYIKLETENPIEQTIDKVHKEFPYFDYSYVLTSAGLTRQKFLNSICGAQASIYDLLNKLRKCQHYQFILFVDNWNPAIKKMFLIIWCEVLKGKIGCQFKIIFVSWIGIYRRNRSKARLVNCLEKITSSDKVIHKIHLDIEDKVNVPLVIETHHQMTQNFFDFRYFFYSESCKQIDWTTAISMQSRTILPKWQYKHSPAAKDWATAFLTIQNSPFRIFLIVIDNVKSSESYLKNESWFTKIMVKQQPFLKPEIKFLMITRKPQIYDSK